MITANDDIEKLIYDEARLYFPELFHALSSSVLYEESPFGREGVLAHIYNDFEELPLFLNDEPSPAPLSAMHRTGYPMPFDINAVRADFPILKEKINGKPLVWFDNAATTQKPACVISRLCRFYERQNSNVHRGAHTLARKTTDAYEGARRTMAEFIGASRPEEIVFVRGATEGINLVSVAWGQSAVGEDDEILISELEHHANIVPWQFLCRKTGASLRCFPVDGKGQVIVSEFQKRLTRRTKLVAFTHVSNVLGTVTPAEELTGLAHAAGALVLIDGAQAVCHLPVNVRALDADFYVFSGHKVFGPTGIGVLYGKYELLGAMAPYQGGGNMILDVKLGESSFREPPHKFEAGTASIADAIALDDAVAYVAALGPGAIARYEHELLQYLDSRLLGIPGLAVVGNAETKSGIVSFHIDDIDSDDAARYLDRAGIAVRAGHHCAQPVLRRFGLENVVRASLAVYNTVEEVDALIDALKSLTR